MRFSRTLARLLYAVVFLGPVACSDDSDGTAETSGGAGGGLSGATTTTVSGGTTGAPDGTGGTQSVGGTAGAAGSSGSPSTESGGAAQGGATAVTGANCNDSKVTCKMMAPSCDVGEVAEIDPSTHCYTSNCVGISECACSTVADCPVSATNEYVCLAATNRCSFWL